jgi:hypothetical protein
MRVTRLLFIVVVLCVIGGFASAHTAAAQDAIGTLLARINNLRAQVGVGAYSLNAALSSAAQSQAQWMVETGQISHTRPDGSGPRTRALNAGYPSSDVSENIYGGTNATVDSAWSFWVNSPIHYAGMTNGRYNEVGIGVARGAWGSTYVLVFGNSGGGSAPVVNPAGGSGSSGASGSGGGRPNSGPPSYVLGLDPQGNIMHQVQPGDTLGDIALIYGYTWDDIPRLMALNSISDVRDLDIGTVFLVPPRGGTFTPTPGGPTATPTPTATGIPPTITPYVFHTATPVPQLIAVVPPGATAAAILPTSAPPTPTLDPTKIAAALGEPPRQNTEQQALTPASTASGGGTSPWLIIAVGVQAALVIGAGLEYARRTMRRGTKGRR